ncbi:hypothetical protein [Cypionkella sp.]|jgi:hypothetical protein|uniref:hypothetical protein n=1 Tax=Cypionkella sp. TaxID=2811411 RepID=UPI003751B637
MLRVVTGPADLAAILADARISALCLGPALGLGAHQAALLAAANRIGCAALWACKRHSKPALFAAKPAN